MSQATSLEQTLYQKFDEFGDWVNKESISDYPCLGGPFVSPKYVFRQITERMESYKTDLDLPEKILSIAQKMKKFGYESGAITQFIVQMDIELSQNYVRGAAGYIRDIYSVTEMSETKEEFDIRVRKLIRGNIERGQALLAKPENLKLD